MLISVKVCYTTRMRKDLIEKYIKEGLSYRKIGEILGISKQRVHQIYRVKNYSKRGSLSGLNIPRERIRKRDNYTCQSCRKKWETGRRFDVHHIDEKIKGKINTNTKGFYKYDRSNMDKLITLCHKCHLQLHFNKIILELLDGAAPSSTPYKGVILAS